MSESQKCDNSTPYLMYDHGYVGSAFHQSRPLRKLNHIDGDALLNMMPLKHEPIRTDYMDVIEADCLRWMQNNAKERKISCRYTVKELIPGLPPLDPKLTLPELYRRLLLKKGISVYKEPEKDALVITWARR